ncbi:type I glutamate--ammonia ligase [Methanomassiliicoccus luminyensis]|jgi:glutamine synthetase|uniref:type I glutamate--ammonia ligase n=1 Tax=Methanomassiliicoccus luminyensis TaxID=1080712 RepID=UPI00037BF862|nr:type I glutamate--ammonia ligase [Methanomassiliicoccus luminyensis]
MPAKAVTSKEDIIKEVKEKDIKFIEMQFSDILGTVKTVAIPAHNLEKALDEGVYIDGSSILGYATIEESDMRAQPILSSFQIYPWTLDGKLRTARLLCQIYDHSGNRFKGDPRWVLERMVEKAKKKGFGCNMGPEFEFFLFKLDANGDPIPAPSDSAGYFDLMALDKGEEVRKDITLNLDDMGFGVEASHHEVAPGQHEVGMRYNDALTVADRIMTLKLTVKTIALRHGMYASFMPKPLFGTNGSGMHVHQSLVAADGKNAFDEPSGRFGLSENAFQYLGGLLAHSRETCAILAPHVNSYKRLVPGYEAPVYISWANMNRSALIRVPAGRGGRTRIELRNPDPSGNPYLQFAVMLASGLDGMEKGIVPPEPVEKDIYHMCTEERDSNGIGSLPENLGAALDRMSESQLMKDTLGDHIFHHYINIKGQEWDEFRTFVTDWELKRYLKVL